jgi:hypothetical protein
MRALRTRASTNSLQPFLEVLGASTASATAAAGSAVVVAAAATATADGSNDSSNDSNSSSSSSSDAVEAALSRVARLLEASLRQGAVSANARCRRTGNTLLPRDFDDHAVCDLESQRGGKFQKLHVFLPKGLHLPAS